MGSAKGALVVCGLVVLEACGAPPPSPSSSMAEQRCPEGMAYLRGGPWHRASQGLVPDGTEGFVLQPFCLDRTKTTVRAYEACVATGQCLAAARTTSNVNGPCNTGVGDRADHPINCVSWRQAVAYCAAHGKRLPDDDEWVYAVRGLDRKRSYPWGEHAPVTQLCWSGVTRRSTTCPTAEAVDGATPEGVLDLVGNLEELMANLVPSSDHAPWPIARGSAYFETNPRALTNPEERFTSMAPDDVSPFTGFRCAKSAPR